jgi:hypothetical protein
MPTPDKRDSDAVAALVENAAAAVTLERMRERLGEITGSDFPAVAALLDLLAESPRVAGDDALCGSVDAVKRIFVRLWEDCEEAAAMGD